MSKWVKSYVQNLKDVFNTRELKWTKLNWNRWLVSSFHICRFEHTLTVIAAAAAAAAAADNDDKHSSIGFVEL